MGTANHCSGGCQLCKLKQYQALLSAFKLDHRFNRNDIANSMAGQKQQNTGILFNKNEMKLPRTSSGKLRHACTVISRVGCLNEIQPIIMLSFIDQWLLNTSICGFTSTFF